METAWAIESLLLFNIFMTTKICITVPNGFQEKPNLLQNLPEVSLIFFQRFISLKVAATALLIPYAYQFNSYKYLTHILFDCLLGKLSLHCLTADLLPLTDKSSRGSVYH